MKEENNSSPNLEKILEKHRDKCKSYRNEEYTAAAIHGALGISGLIGMYYSVTNNQPILEKICLIGSIIIALPLIPHLYFANHWKNRFKYHLEELENIPIYDQNGMRVVNKEIYRKYSSN